MKSRSILMAGIVGSIFAMSPGAVAQPAPVPQAIYSKKQKRGLFNGRAFTSESLIGHKGAGINMAQQKRAAKKSRNVKRHRAACRA